MSLQDPDSAVRCIHMDRDGGHLVAGTEFGRLLLWDTRELDGEWGMRDVTPVPQYPDFFK